MEPKVPLSAKGVFFDLYGTLLILGDMKQAWSDWMGMFHSGLCRHGLSLDETSFAHHCEQFFGKEEPPPAIDGLTVFERRIHHLASNLGLAVELPEIKGIATRATNAWQTHVRPDPEAVELLRLLRQSKTLALISNFDHPPHAHRVLRETGFDEFFQTVVVSGDVGIKKPDPGIFRIALNKTGLSAEEVIYVGDTQEDVDGATAAGIRPVLIARPEDPNQPRILDYTRSHEWSSDRTISAGQVPVMTIGSLREVVAMFTA
jgi:HAD superfamily hydrolase (TIGR01549 family)